MALPPSPCCPTAVEVSQAPTSPFPLRGGGGRPLLRCPLSPHGTALGTKPHWGVGMHPRCPGPLALTAAPPQLL